MSLAHRPIKARLGRHWPRSRDELGTFGYLRRLAGTDRETAIRRVILSAVPAARFAQIEVLVFVIGAVLLAPSRHNFHTEAGREWIARETGHSLRTVSTALTAARGLGWLWRPVRGREGEGVSILSASRQLLALVASAARRAGEERRGRAYTLHKSNPAGQDLSAKGGTKDSPSIEGRRAEPGSRPSSAVPGGGGGGPDRVERQRAAVLALLQGSEDDCEHETRRTRCAICRRAAG